MRVIDRYVFMVFVRVFVICCACLTGIYIVGDFVENLNEFIDASAEHGGLFTVLVHYYASRVPWFFEMISRVAALIAGVFAVTWLQRNNELTALMAAGISRWRILKPVMIGVVGASVIAAVNREVVIPNYREELSQGIREWSGDEASPLSPQFDYMSDILLDGQETVVREKKIIKPIFRLPTSMASFADQITAETAQHERATHDHPTGYRLKGVRTPENLLEQQNMQLDGRTIIYTPATSPWLESDECFVVSYVKFGQLMAGRSWRQFASTKDLIAGLNNPSTNFGADVRVTVHARILQPFLDVTLFFLGIPVVLSKESRNVFISAGSCVLIVAMYYLVMLGSHSLGMNYLVSPVQAAWAPAIMMVPLAIARSGPLRR